MMGITDINEYRDKMPESAIDLYSVDEFLNALDGMGFDDSAFEVFIKPFTFPDGSLDGWFISFINAEEGRYCVVAEDGYEGVDDFIIKSMSLDEVASTLNKLKKCERTATIAFEHYA